MLLVTTGRVGDRAMLTREGWTCIDVTAQSAKGRARVLAPTWDMVHGYKRGELSEDEYTRQYMDIVRGSQIAMKEAWEDTLRHFTRLALLCYCQPDAFCHRLLLADEFVRYAREELRLDAHRVEEGSVVAYEGGE